LEESMAHTIVPDAEKILDKVIPVMDKGHGYVILRDYMGGDERVVDAARVSYGGKEARTIRDNKKLIFYLMQHEHTSPFEQVVLTIQAKMPIFVARQWVRHRTARLNERSGRYSEMLSDMYTPEISRLGAQGKENKQGTEGDLLTESKQVIYETMQAEQKIVYDNYQLYLKLGLSKELARINLPTSIYTEWTWQMDLHNLFHFLKLRLAEEAQWEIRQYAIKIAKFAKAVAPICYAAFEEFVLYSVTYSKSEFERLCKE